MNRLKDSINYNVTLSTNEDPESKVILITSIIYVKKNQSNPM